MPTIRVAALALGALLGAGEALTLGQAPPPSPLPGLTYDAPFFPDAHYDASIPTPDSVLGFRLGDKPANAEQIEAVFKAIASKSDRTALFEYARTHEGRPLHYMVVTTPERVKDLDRLKADLARLADPRRVSAAEGDALALRLPAVAWMAYCIHGDEMSGSDASLAVAHHLAASTDADVVQLLNDVVVIIDPLMNPDGRDRYLATLAQNRTVQPSVDDQSLLHSGIWPYGRMNHYLFDMNRDWIFGTQPESRGRIAAARDWNPHYFVESHEQGSLDTFLFMPPREPINPNISAHVHKWAVTFGNEQGKAFDAQGWRYYTGEWNEEWYPGYSGSWAALRGAIDNLYEQASIATDAVRRPEGTLEPYRLAVHKQLVSSMANLRTLGANRAEVLQGFVAQRREALAEDGPYAKRVYAAVPRGNGARMDRFVDLLDLQGIEAFALTQETTTSGTDRLGRTIENLKLPAGTIVIPTRQPLATLAAALLEFDPRLKDEFLAEERRELLRFGRSRLYDTTAWNLPMLFDVEAYETQVALPAGLAGAAVSTAPGKFTPVEGAVGYAFAGGDDRSVVAAGRLLERGLQVRVSDKPTKLDGVEWLRGSVFVLRADNLQFSGDWVKELGTVADEVRAIATGVRSGMGPGDAPDLGGGNFLLLKAPKVCVVGRGPFSPYSYGESWYWIDHELGLRATYLDWENLGGVDLRRYNVIVLPDMFGAADFAGKVEALSAWVNAGGTLIAVGRAAGMLAKEKGGIGSVRELSDVLTKLDEHRMLIAREWEGRNAAPAHDAVWSRTPPEKVEYPWVLSGGDKPDDDEAKRRDAFRALFMPTGAALAGRVDDRSWLTSGCAEVLPVLYGGGTVLIAQGAADAPVRLGVYSAAPEKKTNAEGAEKMEQEPKDRDDAKDKADEKQDGSEKKDDKKAEEKKEPGWRLAPPGYELRLRMSGLLWPEAADRLAHCAYVTREGVGRGQVILFAGSPTFRAGTLGTGRLFANAVVFGPGAGASQPIVP